MPAPQRILIVEDEPLIAMMLEDFLDALGLQVAGTADCVASALDLIGQGGCDGAILDVNLRGGEQSWAIADRLDEIGIPFIIATGGGCESIADAHRERPMLSKPFTMDSVQKALNGLA
jgi:DNA-binding response OmpR family regulator